MTLLKLDLIKLNLTIKPHLKVKMFRYNLDSYVLLNHGLFMSKLNFIKLCHLCLSNSDSTVAYGMDTLTLLDHVDTRNQILEELWEVGNIRYDLLRIIFTHI